MPQRIEAMIGRYPISVCLAIAMHVIWAVGLVVDPSSINATAPHTLMIATSNVDIAAIIFFSVATLALIGIVAADPMHRIWLLMPQQVVLWFSMVGATHSIFMGQFADGTLRTPAFLLVDQVPAVLIGLGHTAAMLLIARDHLHHD